jgi:ATP/maltotriose-dependent transcriptional regulator MalT
VSIPSALPADDKPLTARELEVLRLIADGKSNDEVGTTLVVSTSTVKAHIVNITCKRDVTSRTPWRGPILAGRHGLEQTRDGRGPT